MTKSTSVSIVIPCYRSGPWIIELVERIISTMSDYSQWELILVNDCSPDNGETWKAIHACSRLSESILGIDLQKNSGQFLATLCGMEHATGEIVVLLDDDLQHLPEEIPLLLEALENDPDADCVMGVFEQKQHSLFRNFGSWVVRQTFVLFHGLPKNIRMSSFRAIRRPAAEMMVQHRSSNPVLGAVLLKSCRRIINVSVSHQQRSHGRTGYRLGRLIKSAMDNLFLATTFPLRLFGYLGLLLFFCSTAGVVYYLFRFFQIGVGVRGFTTLVLLQLFLLSLVSIGLGLLGEYLDRVIDEVDKRPRWCIREQVRSEEAETSEQSSN